MNKTKIFYNNIKKLKKELHGLQKKITILTHKNPDGDAIGSSLGMFLYLKKLQHHVNIVLPTDYPESLKWLPENDKIIVFSEKTKIIIEFLIKHSDYIFLLDFNTLSRIIPIDILLHKTQAIKILIDHHIDPMPFDIMFSDPIIPATALLVFKIIKYIGDLKLIDQQIATCLYVGIVTDTGSFRFPLVNSDTHRITANLLEKEINISYVNKKLFSVYTEQRMKLLSKALQNLKILPDYCTAYTLISAEDLRYYQYTYGDTDDFVNYAFKIKNIIFSVIFIEDFDKKFIKVSFRSIGNFNVNFFAKKHFEGGGHKNAAGGKLDKSLKNIIEYFLNILPHYKEILNKK